MGFKDGLPVPWQPFSFCGDFVIYHKFNCSSEHEFFILLHLPQSLDQASKLFQSPACPICQSDTIFMEGKPMYWR